LEVSGQLHNTAALPPEKELSISMDRRLSGLQSRSGQHGEAKILDSTGTRTLTTVIQPVVEFVVVPKI
jgi:hypothetical protein